MPGFCAATGASPMRATCRENSTIVEGAWWDGRPSGRGAGVLRRARRRAKSGSASATGVTVNVLGRNITATIANLREVQWESLGINFVMVFSPNTFAGAPHAWLATLTDRQARRQAMNPTSSARSRSRISRL